ncbi:DNA methylase [Pseudomonas sp. NPDC089406]|uniref:DNA methylase n=1 Tax=Pseudomonas sp. NPDC089406 TaxID=3364463 RepID=UPI0038511B95
MIPVTAADLDIDVSDPTGHGLYKWLLASFLIGKRIHSSVAVEAYRNLVDRHGLDTPDKLARCSHRDLVRLLGQAGYARYDESTAKRLHALGVGVSDEFDIQLSSLKKNDMGSSALQAWLLGFEGVGPKTLKIFMREAAAVLEHRSTRGSSH